MNRNSGPRGDRRFGDFLFAVGCLVALGLLAVVLAGNGGGLTTENETELQPADRIEQFNQVGRIGRGSLGRAEQNPVGRSVANETRTNPFQSQSTELLFTVEADRPHYWRIDAYDTYRNGSWIRTGGYTNYDGPIEPTGSVTNETILEVTLRSNASSLPTAWQPAEVTPPTGGGLAVSSELGIHSATPLVTGSRYTLKSYQYEPDPKQLLTSRAMYPESIESRYTKLPDGVDEQVASLSRRITNETVTPVQGACAVEQWIETNKQYTPQATHDPGEEPIEQYLFAMDGGTAEYAASSMVVLLRSQGIPARYVTGYAPGESLGNETYGVRAASAHAWTEVYVTGHGWIPFDPTPAAERMAVERQAVGPGTEIVDTPLPADCTVDVDVEPLPDTEGAVVTSTDLTGGNNSGTPTADTATETTFGETTRVNTTIQTSPEPLLIGGQATVKIKRNNEPLSDAMVYLTDEPVGTTNQTGYATITVPTTAEPGKTVLTVQDGSIEEGQVVDVAAFQLTADPQRPIGLPGKPITVTATVDSEPISGIKIHHDGDVVATTDANGTATVPLSRTSTTVEATYQGVQATTQIENRLIGLILRAVAALGILIVVGAVFDRQYNLRGMLKTQTANGIRRSGTAVRTLWRWIIAIPTVIYSIRDRGVRASIRTGFEAIDRLRQQLLTRLAESILGVLLALVVQLYRSVKSLLGGTTAADEDSSSSDPIAPPNINEEIDQQAAGQPTTATIVKKAWATFVRLIVSHAAPTYTPGEIARIAIDKGFPQKPVRRLTNAFRTVAYGPSHPETASEEATEALTMIEQTTDKPTGTDERSAAPTGGNDE